MKYIIGNEYEFSDDKIEWVKSELLDFETRHVNYCYPFKAAINKGVYDCWFQYCRTIQTTTQKKAIEAYALNQRSEYSQAVWDAGEIIDNCPTAISHNTSYEKSLAMKATVVSLIKAGWRKQ